MSHTPRVAIDAEGHKIEGHIAGSDEYFESAPWPHTVVKKICEALDIKYYGGGIFERSQIEWFDHSWVETAENGDNLYVCHPYHLTAKDMSQLGNLGELGWKVWVNGYSSYFTGHTVRVQLELP